MINIDIKRTTKTKLLTDRRIKKIVESTLKSEGISKADISVTIIGKKLMRQLTKKYTGREYQTDVLSFDLSDKFDEALVGEVIVNAQLAKESARKFKTSDKSELALYIIHGLLHLVGYDDQKPVDAQKMHKRSLKLLSNLGYKPPSLPSTE